MIIATEITEGTALRIEGEIYKVLEVEAKTGAAKLGGMVKTKLCNVATNRIWELRFRPTERLEDIQLQRQVMEFLFADADFCTFMNPDTFEQVEITVNTVGPGAPFLTAGMMVPVEFFEGRATSLAMPDVVDARIASTAPPVHAQQDSAWKEAQLQNEVRVQVPLFVMTGDVVRVDIRSRRYVERVRSERKRSA